MSAPSTRGIQYKAVQDFGMLARPTQNQPHRPGVTIDHSFEMGFHHQPYRGDEPELKLLCGVRQRSGMRLAQDESDDGFPPDGNVPLAAMTAIY